MLSRSDVVDDTVGLLQPPAQDGVGGMVTNLLNSVFSQHQHAHAHGQFITHSHNAACELITTFCQDNIL